MKRMRVTDLRIGDTVRIGGGQTPMTVVSILSHLGAKPTEGTVYLDFEGNEGDVWEEEVANLEFYGGGGEAFSPPPTVVAPHRRAAQAVGAVYGLWPEELARRCRRARYVEARAAYAYLLRRLEGVSLLSIGRMLGRHHGSVLNACRRAQDVLDTGHPAPEYRRLAVAIKLAGGIALIWKHKK